MMGGAVGACMAAAAMATGSVVTAAPAKADFEDLLDPIIQPLLTSVTDSLGGFDPAAATDLTSWTDSLLASLNSIDLALPTTGEPATAVAAAASPASDSPTGGTYDIPITVQEGTEPTVQASIDGSSPQTLLVDTGSSGLVIPWDDLGLLQTLELGIPTGFGESGYSGGVDYIYLTYDTSVDYAAVTGTTPLDTTGTPVDVEILSWPTSASAPANFDAFLADNDSTGILGVADSSDAGGIGPTESPLQADGYNGVLVNIPGQELVVTPNNPDAAPIDTLSGAPIPNSNLYETVSNGGVVSGTSSVSDDVDSGGVYGTIPSSLAPDVQPGSVITVYSSQGGTELYSYTVQSGELPLSTSGTSIDSGEIPFQNEPIYINYGNDTLAFDHPLS
jgi:hypothetical protein